MGKIGKSVWYLPPVPLGKKELRKKVELVSLNKLRNGTGFVERKQWWVTQRLVPLIHE